MDTGISRENIDKIDIDIDANCAREMADMYNKERLKSSDNFEHLEYLIRSAFEYIKEAASEGAYKCDFVFAVRTDELVYTNSDGKDEAIFTAFTNYLKYKGFNTVIECIHTDDQFGVNNIYNIKIDWIPYVRKG
jgi:hypothetical protein